MLLEFLKDGIDVRLDWRECSETLISDYELVGTLSWITPNS